MQFPYRKFCELQFIGCTGFIPQSFTAVIAGLFVPPELCLVPQPVGSREVPHLCPRVNQDILQAALGSHGICKYSPALLCHTWMSKHLLLLQMMPCARYDDFIVYCRQSTMALLTCCQGKSQKSTMAAKFPGWLLLLNASVVNMWCD